MKIKANCLSNSVSTLFIPHGLTLVPGCSHTVTTYIEVEYILWIDLKH